MWHITRMPLHTCLWYVVCAVQQPYGSWLYRFSSQWWCNTQCVASFMFALSMYLMCLPAQQPGFPPLLDPLSAANGVHTLHFRLRLQLQVG